MPETMRAIRLTGPVDIDGLTVSDVPRSTKPPPTCSRRSASPDPGRRRPRTPEPAGGLPHSGPTSSGLSQSRGGSAGTSRPGGRRSSRWNKSSKPSPPPL
jgi:hypothetical protein